MVVEGGDERTSPHQERCLTKCPLTLVCGSPIFEFSPERDENRDDHHVGDGWVWVAMVMPGSWATGVERASDTFVSY